ncbi:MAG: hypothetical protein M3Z24_00655 [Chloroflexota bacterium]|nr:hypothetical protein [Chloroflexota bacterium]
MLGTYNVGRMTIGRRAWLEEAHMVGANEHGRGKPGHYYGTYASFAERLS